MCFGRRFLFYDRSSSSAKISTIILLGSGFDYSVGVFFRTRYHGG